MKAIFLRQVYFVFVYKFKKFMAHDCIVPQLSNNGDLSLLFIDLSKDLHLNTATATTTVLHF